MRKPSTTLLTEAQDRQLTAIERWHEEGETISHGEVGFLIDLVNELIHEHNIVTGVCVDCREAVDSEKFIKNIK